VYVSASIAFVWSPIQP